MVVHLNHSGLLRLYYDIPGAPWNWPRWKEMTGIQHGLFPADDAHLPPGWTREDAKAIRSYFEAYRALPTEEAKHAFASVTKKANIEDYSGRTLWRTWIVNNWPRWKIQLKIHNAFEDSSCLWMQIMVANNLKGLPKDIPIGDALDRIAYTLFGDDGLDSNGKILYLLRKSVHIFALSASNNLRKTAQRLIDRVVRNEGAIDAAFQELEKGAPTKQKVTSLVKMVANWRKDVMIWNSEENLLKLAHMELELGDIRKALGGKAEEDLFNPVVVRKKGTKIKSQAFKTLAKSEDLQEILALFDAHFAPDEQLPELCSTSSIPFAEPVDGADPGVEVEASMSYDDLRANLQLDNHGRLLLFNQHRHVGRITSWSASGDRVFQAFHLRQENAELFKPIKMHWHQLAGAHAIARRFFTEEQSVTNILGMLIADDVGLGKSFLALLFAGFLIELGVKQRKKLPLPPLINTFPYLGTVKKIPNRPTLILAPGTLQRQWLGELQVLFKLHAVDIFCYPSSKAACDRFWADNSPCNKSEHEKCNCIIVASHSTLLQEYRLLWEPNSRVPVSERLPFEHPPERLGADLRQGKTLYGQQYLTVIFDKAQAARNYGSTHSAALLILAKSHTRLILTATPLQTRVEDTGAIGRMVGIPHFSTQEYLDEITQDAAAIRRAKQELGSGDSSDSKPNPVVALQVEASMRMQRQFENRLIQRKAASLDFDNKPLLVLPLCKIVDVTLQLQEWELEFVDNSIPEEAIERLSQASALVGTTGLNLTEAYTIIILDQQWSYADDRQAIGRIYRQGQTRPVTAYHILAAGTVDYFIASLSRGKEIVSEAFLTSSTQRRLGDILTGNDFSFGEDQEIEGSTSGRHKSKSSRQNIASSSAATNQATLQDKPPKKQAAKSKRQRVKSKPIIIEEEDEVGHRPSAVVGQDVVLDVDMSGMSSASDREGPSDIESFGPPSTRASSDSEDIEYLSPPPPNQQAQTPESASSDGLFSPISYPSSDEDMKPDIPQPGPSDEPKKQLRSDSAIDPTSRDKGDRYLQVANLIHRLAHFPPYILVSLAFLPTIVHPEPHLHHIRIAKGKPQLKVSIVDLATPILK
ncbi:hypothetical protein EST38_g12186 [Candolleomyces aberdarensis]|uniref:Helicase ATP-binding domain-containing protein n=1 Tax=Candolleomyces aberdarensis TaxID=2316362 RepID=A0A4Q2D323_9AGAR|nr:hypothetical protein EST38_g12186 [Candolleomyces aberdarensis]